jgi:hypothetical protein
MEEMEIILFEGTILRGKYIENFDKLKSDDMRGVSAYPPFPETFPEDFMRKPEDSEIPDKEYGLWYH